MADSLYSPIHIGLLTPNHVEKIGPAIWEFLWLVLRTTKETVENGETIGIVLGGRPIKNAEIAEELGYSLAKVERNISKLKNHGYIITKRTPYGNIFKVRNSKKFYKNRTLKSDGSKKGEPSKMEREPSNLTQRTLNSDGSNKINKDKEKKENIYVEIISYLNEKTGKRFSPKSQANRKLINGRLSEDRTLEDFKQVIDTKVEQWLGNEKMDTYLRPSTLFRPGKFEEYLNEKPVKKSTEKKSDPRDKEIAFQEWMAEGGEPDEFDWSN